MNFIETVESIARFTNYNLNWEILREDNIEFSYRSVVGNLDCTYTIKNNEVLIRISHLLFYINFNIDDTMLDIVNLASFINEVKLINPDIKATLNTFVMDGVYGLADVINGDLDLVIKLPENDNNFDILRFQFDNFLNGTAELLTNIQGSDDLLLPFPMQRNIEENSYDLIITKE
jgi:hypothetical protein